MRFARFAIFILIIGFSLSCGKDTDSDLTIEFKPDTSFILPGVHKFPPCYDSDISGPRLMYPRMDIIWDSDEQFYPAIIKLKFKSPYIGEFECSIDEEITGFYELVSETPGASPTPVTNAYFERGTYSLRDSCALECGGISVVQDKAFKASGEAKVIGYSIDEDGNQTPHSARATIFLQNLD
jgi:hypothetical protein